MIAKVAGGIIGLGLIGTGGVAFVKPEWFGMDYMPNFHALSKDNDYGTKKDNDYKNDNFGGKYRNYLVGVTKKQNDKDSKAWWEWSYRKLKNDGVNSGKFKVSGAGDKNVDSPFGGDGNTKALNQVCKEAYKTKDESGSFEAENTSPSSGNKFKKSEIWKYCSPLGKEPEQVDRNKYDTKNIGNKESEKFISTKDGSNALFWFIRDKEIKGGDDNFEQITVSSASSGTSNHFKKQDKSLRELCEDAYNSPKTPADGSSTNDPSLTDTKKYCVFELTPVS